MGHLRTGFQYARCIWNIYHHQLWRSGSCNRQRHRSMYSTLSNRQGAMPQPVCTLLRNSNRPSRLWTAEKSIARLTLSILLMIAKAWELFVSPVTCVEIGPRGFSLGSMGRRKNLWRLSQSQKYTKRKNTEMRNYRTRLHSSCMEFFRSPG